MDGSSPAASPTGPRVFIGAPLGCYVIEEPGTERLYRVPDRYRAWRLREEYTGSRDVLRAVRDGPAGAIAVRLGAAVRVRPATARPTSAALLRLLPAIGEARAGATAADGDGPDTDLAVAQRVARAYLWHAAAEQQLAEAVAALAEARSRVEHAELEVGQAAQRVAAALRPPIAAPG